MISYPKRLKQVLDFKGIGNSKIHPSDVDAILEFDNKYLIIFEVKLEGVEVPLGQKILFHRIADCWQKTNGEAFVVYCTHNTNPEDIVSMENSTVRQVYHKGEIYKREENIRDFLFRLANAYQIEKLQKSL